MVFYIFVLLFGLTVGSFLNCIIYRLEKGESFFSGRSYCPYCKHILSWRDLIPLLSFVFLKGKCRYCSQKISWQYPLVELATGILFAFTVYKFPPVSVQDIFTIGYWLLAIGFLIIIFVYDLKHYIIPDKIVYPATAVAFLYQLFGILNFEFVSNFGFRVSDLKPLINPIASAILASAFFLAVVLLSQGKWMGVGDIKLAFLMGLILGWPNILVALFLAFFIGAIMGIGLILSGKKTLKSEVPFGPFLVTGTFVALFWGERIVNWYFNVI